MPYRSLPLLLALLFVALPPAHAEPELRGKPDELKLFLQSGSRTVTLEDEATETAYSDQALVTLAVTTENRSLAAALQANQSLRSAVMGSLTQDGIAAENIRTSEFATSPEYGWFGSKPSSYKVVNTMVVRVADERQFQVVAGMADRYKEVQLSDTEFEHSGKEKSLERVRKAALEKVMSAKRFYEGELGLKLKPVAFATQGFGRGSVAFDEVVVTTRKREAGSSSSESFDLPEGFDEVEYRSRVSVTFEVVGAGD